MNNPFLKGVVSQIESVSQNVEQTFGNLNEEQLNWKPNPKSWSVGQCLDHLIVTNGLYSNTFKAFAKGTKKQNLFERMGLFTGTFANLLKGATRPKPTQKTKTFSVFEPSQSDISSTIVADFLQMNKEFKTLISNLDNLNLEKTIMSSPVSNVVVYSLKDACLILANHEERHFNQALNVMNQSAFPK